jgi:hypothetical protein
MVQGTKVSFYLKNPQHTKNEKKKKKKKPRSAVMAHICHPAMWEAYVGGSGKMCETLSEK